MEVSGGSCVPQISDGRTPNVISKPETVEPVEALSPLERGFIEELKAGAKY